MIVNATIKIKIPTNPVLLETMEQYSKAAQIVADTGYGQQICNKRMLHDATYELIRGMSQLPAQLVCSSRDKACEVLKAVFRKHGSKPEFKQHLAIRYDARSFSFKETEVSLCSIQGRIKIPIHIAEYYKQYLDCDVCSADLIYDRKHRMFLHVTLSKEVELQQNGNVVGIDIGVNPLAITSNRQFCHNTMMPTIKRYERLRCSLQAKGTKSASRHLKKMSGREQRFKANVNHIVSKAIVARLQIGDTVALEDVTGIRRGKRGHQWHRWNFRQLDTFVSYKAARNGNSIVEVNPAYTSQRCSKCHSMETERTRGWFHCKSCGYQVNSHLNASYNIRELGMSMVPPGNIVNLPIVGGDEVKTNIVGTATEPTYKPRVLTRGS